MCVPSTNWRLLSASSCWLTFGIVLWPLADRPACHAADNSIVLACDQADGTYVEFQKIHTTIQPAERFVRVDGQWQGMEPNWEGTAEQLQTTYVSGWSIEVHYDDKAVSRISRWKHSDLTGNDYAVIIGKHVPIGLSMPLGYATRKEQGCMLSRKFDPDVNVSNYPQTDWHDQDWDFVESKMTEILGEKNIDPPWSGHSRRALVGTLANWIKDARLTRGSVEETLHPVDFLSDGRCYCSGAANTLVAMCSILQIPARYYGTHDHAFVEFQDDEGRWLFVENQPDTFMSMRVSPPNAYDPKTELAEAQQWAIRQNFDAVFDGGIIDVIANPKEFNLNEMSNLGWFHNWSCPTTYRVDGSDSEADIVARPQVLHDWVFNLYTGYGDYDGEYIHRRGFFMAERLGSVYELAGLYSPRRDDLPYVCRKRQNNDNIMFLTPWRGSYYRDWNNPTRVNAGKKNAVRKQFYMSDLDGVNRVVAAIILGPDDGVDHTIPPDGGKWHYEINGERFPLKSNGGFKVTPNYEGTGMSVHRFEIPLTSLR